PSYSLLSHLHSFPTRRSSDLYFKRVTLGKPIIMGRKTWESLKGPLPGRTNIVITRQPDYVADGVKVVASLDDAIRMAENVALIRSEEHTSELQSRENLVCRLL